ncbi:MAG TPA: ester cyclase [Candidatus Limnocylindria bacterium]|nr:ester cyclase [Candidatus Limnocylindria bacterium]
MAHARDMGSPQELVSRFYEEVLNQRRLEVLDALVAPEFVEHGTPPLVGREAFRSFVTGLLEAFPDFRFTVDDWVAGADRVVARASAVGTQRGEFLGFPPTGRPVSWTAIHIWRVEAELLAERWSEADVLHIVEQLKDSDA